MAKNYFKITLLKLLITGIVLSICSCSSTKEMKVQVYETSANGNSLTRITQFSNEGTPIVLTINSDEKFQTITGFGGSFTESSAYLLNRLSKNNRNKILNAYFSEAGANIL